METQVAQHWGLRDTGKIGGQPAVGSGLHIAAVRAMYGEDLECRSEEFGFYSQVSGSHGRCLKRVVMWSVLRTTR